MTRALLFAVAFAAVVAACIQQPDRTQLLPHQESDVTLPAMTTPVSIMPPVIPHDIAAPLKSPADAHTDLCTNDGSHPRFPDDADLLTRTFCQDVKPGGVMPTPTSLAQLLVQLGLDFKSVTAGNGTGGNPAFALLGHSSALTARKVTPIAPTTFIFTPPSGDGSALPEYTILAFDPGEQFVEVASYDATAQTVNFYVVFFDQACNQAAGGCTRADLLTPKLVSGWSNVRVYEDTTELGNTIFDCHVCHQPDTNGKPFLRMQEIVPPFTHWFSSTTEGGRALLDDFHAVHANDEDYGGIPAALIDASDPSKLAALITQAGFADQPNAFDSKAIEAELKKTPGKSATWQTIYDRSVRGEFIAPPYFGIDVTDRTKLTAVKSGIAAWRAGTANEMPDIADVFLDSALRDMSFAPKLGLDGRGLLTQLCQECHHSQLDMTLSREQFLMDTFDKMTRAERDIAIMRLQLPPDDRLAMPPPLFRTITAQERKLMIEELQN
ncbi:MAG: hypothetical protein QOI41_6125 [Myxococcales bacterium]|nr:hypothetical protein [Myxococcales bacterium]